MRYSLRWPELAAQWNTMVINPDRRPEFQKLAQFAIKNKDRYRAIQKTTAAMFPGTAGVPWSLLAVLHRRESDANFNTYLGNGQSLKKVTTLAPVGRGPWPDFESGAVDALKYDGLTDVIDWRLEKFLYQTELFNGPGYFNLGLPSCYVWGGTNIQAKGKWEEYFDASGRRKTRFNRTVWDTQPGTAPLLKTIMDYDSSVWFERED